MQPLPTLAEIDEAANVVAEWLPRTPQFRWPDRGQIDAPGWLAQVLAQQDRVGDALNVLDVALELNEGHQWVGQLRSTLAGAQ